MRIPEAKLFKSTRPQCAGSVGSDSLVHAVSALHVSVVPGKFFQPHPAAGVRQPLRSSRVAPLHKQGDGPHQAANPKELGRQEEEPINPRLKPFRRCYLRSTSIGTTWSRGATVAVEDLSSSRIGTKMASSCALSVAYFEGQPRFYAGKHSEPQTLSAVPDSSYWSNTRASCTPLLAKRDLHLEKSPVWVWLN